MAKYTTNPDPKRAEGGIEVTLTNPIATRSFNGSEIKRGVITIKKFMDNPARKIVAVMTDDNKLYELWKDAAYDAIGDWTTAQAVARLKEMAEAGYAGA
jgi:hypothetical protein